MLSDETLAALKVDMAEGLEKYGDIVTVQQAWGRINDRITKLGATRHPGDVEQHTNEFRHCLLQLAGICINAFEGISES